MSSEDMERNNVVNTAPSAKRKTMVDLNAWQSKKVKKEKILHKMESKYL